METQMYGFLDLKIAILQDFWAAHGSGTRNIIPQFGRLESVVLSGALYSPHIDEWQEQGQRNCKTDYKDNDACGAETSGYQTQRRHGAPMPTPWMAGDVYGNKASTNITKQTLEVKKSCRINVQVDSAMNASYMTTAWLRWPLVVIGQLALNDDSKYGCFSG
ncbi:hypothetical protein BC629DRAFT_1444880 [Irpex lacteus]|nr:hypothetical protein BC629DRAFT_1444880 [Irpex lacteus]